MALLDKVSDDDIPSAFGADLVEVRPRKLAVPAGRGSRSLAVVPLLDPELRIKFGNLYLKLDRPSPPAELRVTDVRFYEADHKTIKRAVVEDVNRRMAARERVYAMGTGAGDARRRWWRRALADGQRALPSRSCRERYPVAGGGQHCRPATGRIPAALRSSAAVCVKGECCGVGTCRTRLARSPRRCAPRPSAGSFGRRRGRWDLRGTAWPAG